MPVDVVLPPPQPGTPNVQVAAASVLVVVGANGAGKTRFGARVEELMGYSTRVHRISAQRVLAFPESPPPRTVSQAENTLFFGHETSISNRAAHRWGGRPSYHVPNDFEAVLSLLFARDVARDRDYVQTMRNAQEKVPIPDSPAERLVALWRDVFPHRSIILDDGRVRASVPEGNEYKGFEMSDGERVALYLMAQCLCAPAACLIIIDEPEIHLHKSLLSHLWTQLERCRPDCAFMYLTHDLDFAGTRTAAAKIWIQAYDGKNWNWSWIAENDHVPEETYLQILGSRRPILFVEGERGGLDWTIYNAVYPKYYVVPRGPANKVIEATRAFRTAAELHRFGARGLIDRDFRRAEQIEALCAQAVYSMDVAEVENLLCVDEVLLIVAERLAQDPNAVLMKAREVLFGALRQEFDVQVSARTAEDVSFRLNQLDMKARGVDALLASANGVVNSIDVSEIYAAHARELEDVIGTQDYRSALRLYNRKSIPRQIGAALGLSGDEYPKLVLRLLAGDQRSRVVAALAHYLPAI